MDGIVVAQEGVAYFLGVALGFLLPALAAWIVGYFVLLRGRSVWITLLVAVAGSLVGRFHGRVIETGLNPALAALAVSLLAVVIYWLLVRNRHSNPPSLG